MPPKPQPDFESPDIEGIVKGVVESVVAKYALRLFISGLVGAFGLGCWMTKLTLQISTLDSRPNSSAHHEWRLDDHDKRLSRLEQKP